MAEITPIIPSPTVIGTRKIERDEARKNRQKQPQRNDDAEHNSSEESQTEAGEADGQTIHHIDERV